MKEPRGVTLIEVIVAVAIAVAGSFLATIIVRNFVSLQKQAAYLKITQEVQPHLYNMVREVRNSRFIIKVTSDTLKINTFDFSRGADSNSNPDMFNLINGTMTITYQYIDVSTGTFVQRTVEKTGTDPKVNRFLMNQLTPVSDVDYLFQNRSDPLTCPCDRVGIVARFSRGFFRDSPKVFEVEAVVRAYIGE